MNARQQVNGLDHYWLPFTPNRYFQDHPKILASAKGAYYTTDDGRRLFDCLSGLWCCPLGHGHPRIVEALTRQAQTLDYSPAFQFCNPVTLSLADRVAAMAPKGLTRVFFTNSGSEAVDTALKVAYGYHRLRGEASRMRFIGRERGYHGVGFGGMAVGGMVANRKMFGPIMLPGVDHLPHTWNPSHMAYSRGQPTWGAHLADELERLVALHDASTIAAVIVEPMQGSSAVVVPPVGYLEKLREICTRHGILLIFDEVITGFGRLGENFGAQRFGVTPDIITFAKGVTNGIIPMGGIIVREEIFQAFMGANAPPHAIELFHGYTYSGHPMAAACGHAALDVLEEEGLIKRARELEPVLENAMHALKGETGVTDIRNMGLAAAVDLDPIPGKPGLRGMKVFERGLEEGLLLRLAGDAIAVGPPFISTPDEITKMGEGIRRAIRHVFAQGEWVMSDKSDGIRPGRLDPDEYARNFGDSHEPLNRVQALIEADRCYYCYDAPCIKACPTGIDIPTFIQRIAQENVRGAAKAILEQNILGGMCARVCPTEVLCEQACVRNTNEDKPVEIGLLQRFATDGYFAQPGAPLFTRAPATGKRAAAVGAGPAGLAFAHRLAMLGHDVVVFDANPKPGGLNEYGLATYKTVDDFAQKEIDWLLSIGGIEMRCNQLLGRDIVLDDLVRDYDAVFLGMGLAGVNALGVTEPQAAGLRDAVRFIAELRQARDYSKVPIGRKVVVIGGGMTAVDAAVQSKKLGAEDVTIVYRRGEEAMSASDYEQDWAKRCGVAIKHWAAPKEVLAEGGQVRGMRFAYTRSDNGKLVETGETFVLPADMVFKAIGQSYEAAPAGAVIALKSGRIVTDGDGHTSHAKVWAGGDCTFGGRDLTVEAVEHGKRAAISVDRTRCGGPRHPDPLRHRARRRPNMADLTSTFVGIKSPNPFWLASAPPTDKAYNVVRAFEAGWGGAVWKTVGEDPPIVNVNGPRYSALLSQDRRVIGFNNIELISDRPLQVNLDEMRQVKRDWPDRAIVASLMVPCTENDWRNILKKVEDTGCDGVELNFGCPHGMSERGMGSAVGQVPEYITMVAQWCKQHTKLPVIVKLTPNIADIRNPARAANKGGADAVSLINTVNSIMGVDLERMTMVPATDGRGSHGGYCGIAVKPIALNMVAEIARDPETRGLPISGFGGITTWRDAAEFIALGAANVQVCTAAMVYGFKIIKDLTDGLSNFMDQQGYKSVADFSGKAVPTVTNWQNLNLNYIEKAVIDQDLCIQCGRCHVVCEDTSHQAISVTLNGKRHFEVKDDECVGCNLCTSICPVPGCITMRALQPGETDPRTGLTVTGKYGNWTTHPNNPMRKETEPA